MIEALNFEKSELERAAQLVYRHMPPTPQYLWPKLSRRAGCSVLVKHENYTPTGAFKVRGGIVYLDRLSRAQPRIAGVISATRGNHGQSIAYASAIAGIPATIYVPLGNSPDQNSAIAAFGARVVEFGKDFDEARVACAGVAAQRHLHYVPSFHRHLVTGVATYALELFQAAPDLDTVYVPIGMGSGICGVIGVRDLLGLTTEVVGVVARNAPAMALSFEAGRPVPTDSAQTFADGMATREPQDEALAIIRQGAARIVQLAEDDIAEAIRVYFRATHQVAEGAGAAALAALMQERERMAGKKAGVIFSGCNIDASVYRRVLAGETPMPGDNAPPA
jgi:threonine dehydratase